MAESIGENFGLGLTSDNFRAKYGDVLRQLKVPPSDTSEGAAEASTVRSEQDKPTPATKAEMPREI